MLKRNFLEEKVESITYILEMVIAILLAIGVLLGLIDLVKYFSEILFATPSETYDIFQAFLGYALVLIVGVELILMIIHHSTRSILELVLFVIARKMLIYSETMLDLVLGTLAIVLVFVILKFLIPKDQKDVIKRKNFSYSASTNMDEVLENTNLNIPVDKETTIGNFISELAEKEDKPIREGVEYEVGDTKIEITEITNEGNVKEVLMTEKENCRRGMFKN